MPLRETVIRVKGKAADIKRRLYQRRATSPTDPRLFLLKRAGETKRFTVIGELTDGWLVSYNAYRDQSRLTYFDASETFPELIAQTSHIGYGYPGGDDLDEMDVYGLDPSRRDILPPDVKSPAWRVYMVRDRTLRFNIPTDYIISGGVPATPETTILSGGAP